MSVPSVTAVSIELRCPLGFRNLLAKIRVEEETPKVSDNLLELSCRSCLQAQRKKAYKAPSNDTPWPMLVVHRFNLAGDLVETLVEYEGDDFRA